MLRVRLGRPARLDPLVRPVRQELLAWLAQPGLLALQVPLGLLVLLALPGRLGLQDRPGLLGQPVQRGLAEQQDLQGRLGRPARLALQARLALRISAVPLITWLSSQLPRLVVIALYMRQAAK